jgi:hypothetical protein
MASKQDLAKLVVKLEAQTAQFEKALNKANGRIKNFEKRTQSSFQKIDRHFKNLGGSVKAFVGAYIGVRGIQAVVQATSTAQASLAQLEAAVKSTGGAAGFSVPELVDMSAELQRTTTFGDEAIQAMQSLLLTFTQIKGPEFKGASLAIADMATRMGTDLKSAAIQVGKALNDPVLGASALAKSGIQLSESQKTAIKTMVELGDVAGAQQIILKELETQFGGSAAAARKTFGGAIEAVKNAFGDLLEADRGLPGAVAALNEMADVLADPKVKAGFDVLVAGLLKVTEVAVKAAAGLVSFFGEVATGLQVLTNTTGDRVEEINNELEAAQEQAERFGSGYWRKLVGDAAADEAVAIARRRIAELVAEQTKLLDNLPDPAAAKKAGPVAAAPVDEKAIKAAADARKQIDGLIASVNQQIATFGQAEAATLRYRIEQGDLATTFGLVGAAAGPLKEKLLELTAQASAQAATASLEEMARGLEQEIALLDAGAEATLAYSFAQGELAATLEAAGEAGGPLKDRITELTAALEAAKVKSDAAKESTKQWEAAQAQAAQVIESLKTPLEKYNDELAKLDDYKNLGLITDPEILARAAQRAKEEFEKATNASSTFFEKAKENLQDILGEFLADPFSGGLDQMVADFGEAMLKMAAQAVAADIMGAIFGDAAKVGGSTGSGGVFGTIIDSIAGFFGGLGGRERGGPLRDGQAVMVGEAGPELFVAPTAGEVIPNNRLRAGALDGRRARGGRVRRGGSYLVGENAAEAFMPALRTLDGGGGGGGGGTSITQNFSIAAPAGTVSRSTQQQIAAAASRGLAAATRRNN